MACRPSHTCHTNQCCQPPPSPMSSQNLENKEAEKISPRKILHPKDLDIKILYPRDLRGESEFHGGFLPAPLKSLPPLHGSVQIPTSPGACVPGSLRRRRFSHPNERKTGARRGPRRRRDLRAISICFHPKFKNRVLTQIRLAPDFSKIVGPSIAFGGRPSQGPLWLQRAAETLNLTPPVYRSARGCQLTKVMTLK
jgi:hypothetical protein